MNKKTMVVLIVALAALLAWSGGGSGGGSLAQGEGGVAPQAVLTPLLQYQGRLTDPGTGEPVADGNYTMTFRLYDVPSGGSALWTETKDVPVADGLFNTVLGDTTSLDQSLFNGQELWLGVKVGADAEATPRQQVLAVAYALSLVPGAQVTGGSDGQPVLDLEHTGDGNALRGVISSANPARTAVMGVNYGGGFGVAGYTNSDESAAVGGYNNGAGPAVSGESVLGSGGYFSSTSGLALHAVGEATVTGDLNVGGSLIGGGHNHSGADIASGTVADARVASTIARDSEIMPTVLANDGAGSGLDADRLDGYQGSALFALNESETVSGRPRFYGGTSGSSPPFYVDSTYRVAGLNADYLDGYSSSAFALSSQVPLLKYRSWSETINVNATRQYFTNDRLIVTPPANGYILIMASTDYNCGLDVETQSYFGVYVTTSTTTPTSGTGFSFSELVGFAYALEPTSTYHGNFNPNVVVYPRTVTGGVTYYIWLGVDGLNVDGLDCSATSPRIIATFYLSGM